MTAATAEAFLVARLEGSGLKPLGSAFGLGGRSLATAFHVISGPADNLHVVLPGADVGGYQDVGRSDVRCIPVTVTHADPIHDLAIIALPPPTQITGHRLCGADSIEPGHAVCTFGFPHADYGRVVLTQQNVTVGAKVLIRNQGIGVKHLVLNALTRPGESGGPVFDATTGDVVAVITGAYTPNQGGSGIRIGNMDPHALHQTTHAVSAEYLAAMMP